MDNNPTVTQRHFGRIWGDGKRFGIFTTQMRLATINTCNNHSEHAPIHQLYQICSRSKKNFPVSSNAMHAYESISRKFMVDFIDVFMRFPALIKA